MDAAIAGLIGVAIGAASSLGAVWIQSHYLAKRERAKAVLDFAIRHRSEAFVYADKIDGPKAVAPLAVHVHYQQGLLNLIETNKMTTASLEKLHQENEDVYKFIIESDQARSAARVAEQRRRG